MQINKYTEYNVEEKIRNFTLQQFLHLLAKVSSEQILQNGEMLSLPKCQSLKHKNNYRQQKYQFMTKKCFDNMI